MDTASNAKLIMAEKCTRNMEKYIGNMREIKRENVIKEIEAKLMEIKYSYGEIEDLKTELDELKEMCKSLISVLGGEQWVKRLKEVKLSALAIAHVKFCLNILYNLDSRLRLPDDPVYSVDIRIGEIESIMKHPNADKLRICNVNVGRVITVVTNINNVKEGEKLAVALLPPAEFRGVVSEGMFLSHDLKEGKPGTLPKLSDEEINNVKKEILGYLR